MFAPMRDVHVPTPTPMFYFDCPLCGTPLEVRLSKKQKPYVTCGDCSLQMFVRGPSGAARFDERAHTEDGRTRAAVVPKVLPRPKGRPGRPRKESTERARRYAPLPPVSVLLTGRET